MSRKSSGTRCPVVQVETLTTGQETLNEALQEVLHLLRSRKTVLRRRRLYSVDHVSVPPRTAMCTHLDDITNTSKIIKRRYLIGTNVNQRVSEFYAY